MLIGSFFLIYERWIRGGVVGQDGGRVVRLVRLVIKFVRLGFALVFVSVCVFSRMVNERLARAGTN